MSGLAACRFNPPVFNFWDPAHYLVHGQGLQTWEYSAEYAIRSWAFVALYALPGRIIAALTSHGNKVGPAPWP